MNTPVLPTPSEMIAHLDRFVRGQVRAKRDLAEELKRRQATIAEFFLAYVYSNTDNIQANLHYLDYSRLKREQEKKLDPAE